MTIDFRTHTWISQQWKARKFLEMKQKMEVIKEVKLGRSPQEVDQSFWISVSQVYKIYKTREVIANNLKDTMQHSKDSKIMKRKALNILMWIKLFLSWLCYIHNLRGSREPLPVSRSMIQARANYEAKVQNISKFSSSDGWFWRWHWRFNIGKSVRLKEEAGGVNLEEAEKDMRVMRDTILAGGYQMQNMDETTLLYRFIPNRTCCSGGR